MRDNLQWYSDPGSTCEKQDIKHITQNKESKKWPILLTSAWQTLVKDAIPTIKEKMATRNEQVPDEIKLYVDDPRGLAKELEPDDMISKHFNIDHIEEGLILIYPQ
ncbi:unnamed protein product [Rhizophagus irregularis]|nr:unnamed protein product [Rhizophagus irregularis]